MASLRFPETIFQSRKGVGPETVTCPFYSLGAQAVGLSFLGDSAATGGDTQDLDTLEGQNSRSRNREAHLPGFLGTHFSAAGRALNCLPGPLPVALQ